MERTSPLLRRDDPTHAPLVGNIKVTRQDWLNAALETLISDGIEQVKIMALANRMSVSRSSFYWYFKSRQHLLDTLLEDWLETNTRAIITHAAAPAETITQAVCNVFLGFLEPRHFNTRLDFAIRDWARRSKKVRHVLETSDTTRIDAIAAMFQRFGYVDDEALARARTLYYMQIGYNDADLGEPMTDRLRLLPYYLLTYTGREAPIGEIEAIRARLIPLD